ncbi:DUF4350 domain-containing protein [Tichowtungia aerotolerans]|uniref:DUF4350 domain-containing protein n=1 Tax=Tichowtungia aerotolerans TaxID=2697043 RepID=A0A6P1M749_9BACT|nr:DUF4350 domain-containing protein [Tichowtungia aerotolerans]QHI68404.1 hypothetical protein GT409_02670 [Tichowtungia aerotolerans]
MTLRRNIFTILVVTALLLLLGGGLTKLFMLRFSSGNMYPPYSSLRADPKGCRILFESLKRLPGLSVERTFESVDLPEKPETGILMLGGKKGQLLHIADHELRPFLLSGGRAVLACRPEPPDHEEPTAPKDLTEEKESEPTGTEEEKPPKELSANDRWGIQFCRFNRSELKEMEQQETALPESPELDPVPWKSSGWFDELSSDWTVIYRFLDKPVIIERSWGEGSVVLIADSYLFSNEAMVTQRSTATLTRLIGPVRHLLFDETHLGISSRESVMMLLNRYHLQGVLAALLVLAGLFLWQQSTGLIPKQTPRKQSVIDSETATDSMQGMTNLLKRHIPRKKLMETLIAEWRSSFRNIPSMQHRNEQLDKEIRQATEKTHPVDLYNQITKTFNERKHSWHTHSNSFRKS